MSAIYGIINKDSKPVEPEMLQKMKQAMSHRATHGGNTLICDNAAFGFCHLVVYPNQEHEQLPLQDGDLLFTANAHLHNRNELLSKLGFDAKQFATTPDSYLILAAYKKWGEDCVHHLDGEYVYAIWNKVSKELFISNDHIGYKALYYYDTPGQFIFCSEIKGIEAVKTTTNYFDANSLIYHGYRQGDPEATYNKEIRSLIGATLLTWSSNNTFKKKYWLLQKTNKHKFSSDTDWFEATRELLWKAVENRLNTQKPVGITLSGGLDSSSIACILSKILKDKNKPLYAFSSMPVNEALHSNKSERSYIEIVNHHCGNIIQTYVSAEGLGPFDKVASSLEIDEALPNYFHYMDQALLQEAQKKNVSILYSGFGGDFWVSAKSHYLINMLFKSRQWNLGLELLRKLSLNEKTSLLKTTYKHYFVYTSLYKYLKKFKPSWKTKNYWQDWIFDKYPIDDSVKSIILSIGGMINDGWISGIMGVFDKRGETYGVASPNPLFDRNLMEFMADVPLALFLNNGHSRSFIRHAMEGILPKEIQWRNTKSPYVLDHRLRTMQSKNVIDEILISKDFAFLFDKFYTKRGVEKLLTKTDSTTSADLRKILSYEISYLGTSSLAMHSLKEKGYNFGES
jgi:asparagine synthase (glutamine-hydrolysing)